MALPLQGVRVVDLTRILAGPFATMQLADLGADVIKVERPGRGDETRHWGPPFWHGTATYFLAVNRNKRGVTIDLTLPAGRQVLWSLLAGADVLVSNFRAGTMAAWGFGWQQVHERCPQLVYALINGYGDAGEFARRPAFDLVIQAESGLMDLTGDETGPPTKAGISIADEVAGMYLVQGVLAALWQRQRDGTGQRVEVALHDAMLSMLTYQAQQYLSAGVAPRRMGNAHPSLVPYRPFGTADGTIVVGVAGEIPWRRFCIAIERTDLMDDPRFASNALRVEHRDDLERILGEHLKARSSDDWLKCLADAGVPCGKVRSAAAALDGPECEARAMIVDVPGSDLRTVASPVRMAASDGSIRRPPPGLGEHTDEVLAEIGYEAGEIAQLRHKGAI